MYIDHNHPRQAVKRTAWRAIPRTERNRHEPKGKSHDSSWPGSPSVMPDICYRASIPKIFCPRMPRKAEKILNATHPSRHVDRFHGIR